LKKVVLLAPYFLPRRRVGAWRPFKFAIHLRKYGWAPYIITIKENKGSLTAKEASLLADIPVYEIKSPFDFTHNLSRHLDINGQADNKNNSVTEDVPAFNHVLDTIDRYFPIDTWLPLFLIRQRNIENYIRKIDPQVLWSTGDPWSNHWLARTLAENLNLPWVADFRDPWTLSNIASRERPNVTHRINREQEKKIVQRASVLTFTARQTEKLYTQKYGDDIEQTTTIYNSFDSKLFNTHKNGAKYFSDETLNLLFFGKFRQLSPAQSFIELLKRIRDQNPTISDKIRMYSFGSLCSQDKILAREMGVLDNFISLKPIALENALSVLTQADILWLSTHQDRRNIIPAKLWDYLAARRPVISVAPNPEIREILHQTGAGLQFDINNSAIVDKLCQAARAKEKGQPMPVSTNFDGKIIKQYDAARTTRKLADVFDRLS